MPHPGLTTEKIVDAAAAIADADGLDAMTLTRLAENLGVRPPSLYKHVDGLDEIRHALALRGLDEANLRLQRAVMGKAGEAALIALAHAYWQFARERPGLYTASLRPVGTRDRELAAAADMLLGTVLAVLAGYSVKGNDALHATRGLRAIIHGFVSLDASGGFRLKLDLQESFDRLLAGFSRDLAARAKAGEQD
jgi:AcrR family transcriptional regulator